MGKVYLVGAGPGDPRLLTVNGKRLLEEADVVIYDRLIENSLLNHLPERCETIYAGKRPGKHRLTQDEINEKLVEKAREGKKVVRLKGGDPFLLGRGGEEARYLRKHDISFEIVPGITSALGVPAYAGIPATSRDVSSSAAIITGHEDPDKKESSHDWRSLAKGPDTLIFLMGVKNLPRIQKKLLENGRPEDTPAAVIERGTMPEQKTLYSTLDEISQEAEEYNISPPAVIVVGEVVGKRVEWRSEMPLAGLRVLNTRPKKQARDLTERLEAKGAVVREVPAIKIAPPEDSSELDEAIERVGTYDWIVFTSTNGVDHFFKRMDELDRDIRSLEGINLAAIGEKTALKLEDKGLRVDHVPSKFRAEELLSGLKKKMDGERSILLPRTPKARDLLPDGLQRSGHDVDEVETYRTLRTSLPEDVEKDLKDGLYNMITFTSSSTVENFLKMIDDERLLENMIVAAIGPVTAETARKNGLEVDIIASEYDIEGLYEAIMKYVGEGRC
ncbi:MAG: uroporphyrinogen-III C-methyltransferase [Thermoplasmata archaeon]